MSLAHQHFLSAEAYLQFIGFGFVLASLNLYLPVRRQAHLNRQGLSAHNIFERRVLIWALLIFRNQPDLSSDQ